MEAVGGGEAFVVQCLPLVCVWLARAQLQVFVVMQMQHQQVLLLLLLMLLLREVLAVARRDVVATVASEHAHECAAEATSDRAVQQEVHCAVDVD